MVLSPPFWDEQAFIDAEDDGFANVRPSSRVLQNPNLWPSGYETERPISMSLLLLL
jgi:hypothetical protein